MEQSSIYHDNHEKLYFKAYMNTNIISKGFVKSSSAKIQGSSDKLSMNKGCFET